MNLAEANRKVRGILDEVGSNISAIRVALPPRPCGVWWGIAVIFEGVCPAF